MTGYRMVFDRENLKLGWSRSNCEFYSLSQSYLGYMLILLTVKVFISGITSINS